MITYFDTSALIPLLIDEPASTRARRLWADATRMMSVRLLYPEARAGLARARRMGRLSEDEPRAAVAGLESLDMKLVHIEVTARLAARAGDLAEAAALRGYDAVHLTAAESLADQDVLIVTGDAALGRATRALGLATADLY